MRTVASTTLAVFLSFLTFAFPVNAYEVDDTVPEITDRVARISFIRGDVQIRRDGTDEWEKADLNLPIVEGDEIATDANGRLEIQFNGNTHLRLAENTSVQIRQLADGGIAVSVSRGIANVRLRKFDAEKEFFEIDAPSTTVALRREGAYKIAAEGQDVGEIKVSVTDGGEARIYSANSGFTLKSGRSAKVFLTGSLAGEWETADAARFADEFDSWTAERDDVISQSLKNAHYGKYYDQDIYAADELSDNGDWQYTSDYGFVWQPNQSALRNYSDWSPYRYGTWRWVPPFGWTWVNDEPWGWATYHHGRWVWYRGRWVWTPYGYYRSNRSWWYPALVVVRVINRNICWYPLPYNRGYYNYNHGYHDWVGNRRRRDRDRRGDGVAANPTPIPPATGKPYPGPIGKVVPIEDVPEKGVITLPKEDFGTSRKIGYAAPPDIAKGVLKRTGITETPPELPLYETIKPRIGKEILVSSEKISKSIPMRKTGAAERTSKEPLDGQLRQTRFFGDRRPTSTAPAADEPVNNGRQLPRNTGAVERVQRPKPEQPAAPRDEAPVRGLPRTTEPIRRDNEPEKSETPVKETPRPVQPIRRELPPRQEAPRYEPPPRTEQPRQEPPSRKETPAPRNDPPPRRDPPAPKSESPKSSPPATKSDPGSGSRKKDG